MTAPDSKLPDSQLAAGNGILTLVGGAHVAEGSNSLPVPCSAEEHTPWRRVVVEVPDLGLVHLSYELVRHKHGRSWHWSLGQAGRQGLCLTVAPEIARGGPA
jgi:hypothetical protein